MNSGGKQTFRGRVNAGKCVGCLLCQLSCSLHTGDEFNISLSLIRVCRAPFGEEFNISFAEECDNCFLCVTHCTYGALELD